MNYALSPSRRDMIYLRLIQVASWLTVLGGLFWVVKAGSILLTGYQPPLIFEVAPMLFALGLLGLYLCLGEKASGWGKAGLAVAVLAFFTRLGTTIYETTPNAVIPTAETFEFPYSLLVLVGAAGVFIGLILPGVDDWRARTRVPLAAGLLVLPAALTGFIHIEAPPLLIGLSGIWVGSIIPNKLIDPKGL